jgi:hypothetical protein
MIKIRSGKVIGAARLEHKRTQKCRELSQARCAGAKKALAQKKMRVKTARSAKIRSVKNPHAGIEQLTRVGNNCDGF